MGTIKKAKKLIFDIAKKNKAFRIVARKGRDELYAAKMTLDAPLNPIDEKKVFFITFSGRGYSDSPKAIYNYMLNSPEYKDYHFVWSFREPEKYEFLRNDRTEVVKYRSKAENKALRTSAYWISNYRMLDHQKPRKGQVYVQCWHGTPLKRLGYDLLTSDNVMNSIAEIHEKYRTDAKKFDYLLSPSPFATEKFASAWNLNETGQRDKILEEGYPRNDALINASEEYVDELREKLGVQSRKAILYAPTWRDNQHTSALGYTYKTEVDFDLLRQELGDEYVILFRAHYLVANSFDFEKYKDFVIDVSGYPDINDLYLASDILVTDYSSVFFDYSNLRKPIIYYMYDLEEYAEELRGFYMSLEELPGPIVREEKDLIEELKKCDSWTVNEKYESFCKRFNPYEDGQSAKRVVHAIIGREK